VAFVTHLHMCSLIKITSARLRNLEPMKHMPMYDQITIFDLQANTDDQSKAKRISSQAEKVSENIMQFKPLVCTAMF
jgi:hypothetical protein